MNFSVTPGVRNLLKRVNEKSSYVGDKFFFKGDLNQSGMIEKVCNILGFACGFDGGLPFVASKEAQQKVIQYLIKHQIEGWWLYVTNHEYCKIKGQFFFNGMCFRHYDKIREIADKLGISLCLEERGSILYTPSEESYNAIIAKLKEDYGVEIEDQ